MNPGPDVPGGSEQSHPLYPQGPLSETEEEEAQAKARSRVRPPRLLEKIQSWPSSSARTGLCPGKGSLPCSTPAEASHIDRLHLTVAVVASRALSGLRMKCLFTSTVTHILSGQTVTPHLKMLFPFHLITFQGMQFPSGKSPWPLLPSMKAVFKQE